MPRKPAPARRSTPVKPEQDRLVRSLDKQIKVAVAKSAPAKAAAPVKPARAERVHADPEAVKAWVLSTGKTQREVARLCGLAGGPGPLGAALHGRPLSPGRLALWQATYAAAEAEA